MPVINTQVVENINITENGTYDVARYTNAIVNTPVAPDIYKGFTINSQGVVSKGPSSFNPANITSVPKSCFAYLFYEDIDFSMNTIEFTNLTFCGDGAFKQAFCGDSNSGPVIKNISFPKLICCKNNSSDFGVDEFYNMCGYNKNIETDDFSSYVGGLSSYTFRYFLTWATNIKVVKFDSITDIKGWMVLGEAFRYSGIKTLNFPALRISSFGSNASGTFQNMLQGVTSCTIHFPKNLNPETECTTISSLMTYPNFGGTDTVLVFDLPSTNPLIGVNGSQYDRNPKYDTQTALAWKVGLYNPDPIYYTSSLNDPQIGDTIYSDAECTVAVTTIDSIA